MKEIINASLERAAIKRGESSQPLRYLEIGVHKGETFQSVSSRIKEIEVIKEGVDPYGPFSHVHRMTSQVFFAINETFWKKKYDVIFLDALHFSPILDQEIGESLKILNEHGVLILDDTVPEKESSGSVEATSMVEWQKNLSYPLFKDYDPICEEASYKYFKNFPGYPEVNGDCWKSVARIRMTRPDLKVGSILPPARGCTLIVRGSQTLLASTPADQMDWDYFLNNHSNILQPTSVEDVLYNN